VSDLTPLGKAALHTCGGGYSAQLETTQLRHETNLMPLLLLGFAGQFIFTAAGIRLLPNSLREVGGGGMQLLFASAALFTALLSYRTLRQIQASACAGMCGLVTFSFLWLNVIVGILSLAAFS
jgi:hypothetical protein